jgi:integrase
VDVSFTTDAGQPVRLQRRGFSTRGEALVWAERETVLIKAGAKTPRTRASAKLERLTTTEALSKIMAFWRDSGRKKESTLFSDGHAVRKHLLPAIGRVPWIAVTQEQVDLLVRVARDMPTPRHLSVLKAALRDSKRAGLDPPQVLLDVPRRPANDKTDFLSAGELEKVCAQADPLMGACFRFLFHTGLRIGEFMALEWPDLDLGEGRELVTVRRTVFPIKGAYSVSSPKSGKSRTVPLNASAVEAIEAIARITRPGRAPTVRQDAPLGERLLLASSEGGYRRKTAIGDALSNACRDARIRRVTCHTLRHSFGSNLVQAGVDLYQVCTLMGHSSVAMTQRYAHLSADGLRSSARKLDALSRKAKKSH